MTEAPVPSVFRQDGAAQDGAAQAITDGDLHRFIDNQLDAARRAEVAAYLASHPEAAQNFAEWQKQNALLRGCYEPALHNLPTSLQFSTRPFAGKPKSAESQTHFPFAPFFPLFFWRALLFTVTLAISFVVFSPIY